MANGRIRRPEATGAHIRRGEAMITLFKNLKKDESGASLIEYVLIAALISIATIAGMGLVNTGIDNVWTRITTAL